MEEVFVEQIIKRKTEISGIALRLLLVVLFAASIASFLWLGMLGFTLAVLIGYVMYLGFSYTSIEYEYSFLNGELSIDKIMGQRKRKHLAEFQMKEAEIVAPSLSDEVVRASQNTKTKDFSSGRRTDRMYSMIVAGKDGRVQVVFEPDDKLLDAMYHVRPNIVRKEIR